MWISIEKGGDAVALTERINRRKAEKEELEEQLAIEQNKRVILSEAQVLAFLNYVCELPSNDMMKRRAIVNIFVHSIYLYDDHLTLIINGSNKPVTVDDIPFDDIEAAFNGEKAAMEQCSHSSDIVPPKERLQTKRFAVFYLFCKLREGSEPHRRCCGGLPSGRAATDKECERFAKQTNEAKLRSPLSPPNTSQTNTYYFFTGGFAVKVDI